MYESFTDSRPAIESKKQVVIKGFNKTLSDNLNEFYQDSNR